MSIFRYFDISIFRYHDITIFRYHDISILQFLPFVVGPEPSLVIGAEDDVPWQPLRLRQLLSQGVPPDGYP